ncbi:MAG: DUF1343 domain-containing protein [Eubacteriales bacterium]|nr:DUF1343 domain-containing protein [Eubacteriales bacterium]
MVRNGIDRCTVWSALLKGKRVGLLTTGSGFDAELRSTVDVLRKEGIKLTALYAPEHGIHGASSAGDTVDTTIDHRTGLTVYSLYRKDSKRFTENMFTDVDLVVYDIADVGARFFTYLTTLLYTLEDCAAFGIPLVVLDRVNPLGGMRIEGAMLADDCVSFVGGYPMPIRYGLTAGEYAQMVNSEQKIGCDLTIVEVAGWRRNMLFPETGLPWIPPSPSLQHFENALLYPGTCLLEGTNLSEGRGTSDPFLILGAPYIDADVLAEAMNDCTLSGVRFLPAGLTPTASKYQQNPCYGVKIIIDDPYQCEPVHIGITLLDKVRECWPQDFAFLPPSTAGQLPIIDLLSGNHTLREGYRGEQYWFTAQKDCEAFACRRKPYLLYGGM